MKAMNHLLGHRYDGHIHDLSSFSIILKRYKNKLTRQQILTIRGQAKKGEFSAALKGMKKCLFRSMNRVQK